MPRLTMRVRNTDGVKARLQARNIQTRLRILDAVDESASRVLHIAQDLCPRDTGFMAEKMRLEFFREGYSFAIGWHADDFLGQTRRGGQPTPFYPPYVVLGTSRMAGRDPLTPAVEEERPRAREAFAKALRGG